MGILCLVTHQSAYCLCVCIMKRLHNIFDADLSLKYKVTMNMLIITVELGLRILVMTYGAEAMRLTLKILTQKMVPRLSAMPSASTD